MKRPLLALVLLFAVVTVSYLIYVFVGLPPRQQVKDLAKGIPGPTALMLQRDREAAKAGKKARRQQQWVPISRISRHLLQAVIASEDQKFFGHEGVDWEALQKSLEKNVEKGRAARGGSTLTQQLAKNLFFGTEKTVTRKLRELVVTRWLEADLSKRRILELYVNVIEWGPGVYGAEAAAHRWYGQSAASLGPDEAAGLAAMIPNPRRLNPETNAARHARATKRVLWLMAHAGFLERTTTGLGAEPPPVEALGEASDALEEQGTP